MSDDVLEPNGSDKDECEEAEDWIEIVNDGDVAVELDGMLLQDAKRRPWR